MLIQTIKEGETITLKTNAGEEVVARLKLERDDAYVVNKPMVVVATPQGGIGLAPFGMTINADSELVLNKDGILYASPTQKDFASKYIEATTGLKVTT